MDELFVRGRVAGGGARRSLAQLGHSVAALCAVTEDDEKILHGPAQGHGGGSNVRYHESEQRVERKTARAR